MTKELGGSELPTGGSASLLMVRQCGILFLCAKRPFIDDVHRASREVTHRSRMTTTCHIQENDGVKVSDTLSTMHRVEEKTHLGQEGNAH